MNDERQVQPSPPIRPAIRVLLAVLLAAALTGYFVGLRQSRQASQREAVYGHETLARAAADDVPVAPKYAEQPRSKAGVNRAWHSDLASLRQASPAPPPKTPAAAADIAALLKTRESRRAFDGAPPSIPHPTPPLGVAACLACHGNGAAIGTKHAAKMSHPLYVNCTQCHVEVTHADHEHFWENTFAALRPAAAARAYPGAPPPLPHPAWMRQDCQSCHGPTGPTPLRTTHPERQNCLQCHALSFPQDLLPHAAAGLGQPTDLELPTRKKP